MDYRMVAPIDGHHDTFGIFEGCWSNWWVVATNSRLTLWYAYECDLASLIIY